MEPVYIQTDPNSNKRVAAGRVVATQPQLQLNPMANASVVPPQQQQAPPPQQQEMMMQRAQAPASKRRRKVRILNKSHYEIIERVENYFEEEKNLPNDPDLNKVEERLSKAVGFPISSIRAAEQKYEAAAGRRSRKVEKVQRVSPQEIALIRQTYHELMTGKPVTVKVLHTRLQERYQTAPNGKLPWSETTLWRILKDDLKYAMGKRNPPQEPEPSAGVRNKFLHKMRDLRFNNPPIVYVGEVLISEGLWAEPNWQTDDYPAASAIANHPSNRCGTTYFFVAAGGRLTQDQYGFVPNTMWRLNARPGTEQFMAWFEQKLLPNLPPKTVVVLEDDNDIGQGGRVASLPINSGVVAASVVGQSEDKNNTPYRTDEAARATGKGITVVRLPYAHREMSAIEPIWHQIKTTVRYQGERNAEGGIPRLVEEAAKTVTAQDWRKAIARVEGVERQYATQPVQPDQGI